MALDFSRLTDGRSFTDLLPSKAQLRKVVRAVPAALGAADGITLITLYVDRDWGDFAAVTIVSLTVWVPIGVLKVMHALSNWEDARAGRRRADQAAAHAERQLVIAHATAESMAQHRQLVAAALPAPPAAPVVLDYEVGPILPPGAETGWVYDDANGTTFVVVASPDGPRLARLSDMQLARAADVVPPLSVSGAIEVNVLPIEFDTSHATTREAIHG